MILPTGSWQLAYHVEKSVCRKQLSSPGFDSLINEVQGCNSLQSQVKITDQWSQKPSQSWPAPHAAPPPWRQQQRHTWKASHVGKASFGTSADFSNPAVGKARLPSSTEHPSAPPQCPLLELDMDMWFTSAQSGTTSRVLSMPDENSQYKKWQWFFPHICQDPWRLGSPFLGGSRFLWTGLISVPHLLEVNHAQPCRKQWH